MMVSAALNEGLSADTPPGKESMDFSLILSGLTSDTALSLSRQASIFSLVTDCSWQSATTERAAGCALPGTSSSTSGAEVHRRRSVCGVCQPLSLEEPSLGGSYGAACDGSPSPSSD